MRHSGFRQLSNAIWPSSSLRTSTSHIRPTTLSLVRHFAHSKTAGKDESELPEQSNETLRRAMIYVPSCNETMIKKSLDFKADCIIYDLEDGVAINRKGRARALVTDALNLNKNPSAELAVRMNSIGSGWEMDDLNVILQSKKLDTIVLPKVEHASHVEFVSRMIDNVAPAERRSKIGIVACVESAMGLLNIRDIASADKRVNALLFAAEDYCSSTGMIRTPSRRELYYPRSVVTTTAHAYGLQAIDMVCIDFHNKETLKEESREGMEMGFTGKQVIHPDQIDIVQNIFAPSNATILRAWRIVEGYKKCTASGKGAFDLDGQVIDLPLVKWAEKMLSKARKAGIPIEPTIPSKTEI